MSKPRQGQSETGPLLVGSIFREKYEILEVLGRGGHAWVYHARDLLLQRDVAIKVVHRRGGASEEMLQRGRQEVQILCSIEHENVVRIYDADLTNGRLSIVMERLWGRSVRAAYAEHGWLTVEEVLELMEQIGQGAYAAHRKNIVHRDIKPENAFICADNLVKVLDFGVAKIIGGASWTTRDASPGTSAYMSPEQVQGLPKIQAPSDVYSMGVMMYEGLCGRHPLVMMLEGPEPTIWDIARAIVWRVPPLLHELNPSIPPYVSNFVSSSLAKRSSQRPGHGAEFAAEARACRERWLEELRRQGKEPVDRDLSCLHRLRSGSRESQLSTSPVRAPREEHPFGDGADSAATPHAGSIAQSSFATTRRVQDVLQADAEAWPSTDDDLPNPPEPLSAHSTLPLGSTNLTPGASHDAEERAEKPVRLLRAISADPALSADAKTPPATPESLGAVRLSRVIKLQSRQQAVAAEPEMPGQALHAKAPIGERLPDESAKRAVAQAPRVQHSALSVEHVAASSQPPRSSVAASTGSLWRRQIALAPRWLLALGTIVIGTEFGLAAGLAIQRGVHDSARTSVAQSSSPQKAEGALAAAAVHPEAQAAPATFTTPKLPSPLSSARMPTGEARSLAPATQLIKPPVAPVPVKKGKPPVDPVELHLQRYQTEIAHRKQLPSKQRSTAPSGSASPRPRIEPWVPIRD